VAALTPTLLLNKSIPPLISLCVVCVMHAYSHWCLNRGKRRAKQLGFHVVDGREFIHLVVMTNKEMAE
jgi:hypothetical protein